MPPEIVAPPDHLFRVADEVECPDCVPDTLIEADPVHGWALEVMHIFPCERQVEVLYV